MLGYQQIDVYYVIIVCIKVHHNIVTDNVTLSIDGVLYLRILNPYLASYGVEDPEFAITQLAQTTMRYVRNISLATFRLQACNVFI